MTIENNVATAERVNVELANGFDALNVCSNPEFIQSNLIANIGNFGLVDICKEYGQRTTYHPDGIYEIARFGKTDVPLVYSADILDEDGSLRRVKFSVNDLGGVLVPKRKRSGFVFPMDKHPGRFSKMKLRGKYGFNPKKVLETQVGNVVLINDSGKPVCYGEYRPVIVENCNGDYCHVSGLDSNGGYEPMNINYRKISGLFVAEDSAPKKLFWTD
jgi:hypothetical protein